MKLPKFTLPPLSIHCWGGIGSQLGAYALFSELREEGDRHLNFVLHSSGVTRRDDSDFRTLFPNASYTFIDDYNPKNQQVLPATNLLSNLRNKSSYISRGLIRRILDITRIVVFSEVKSSKDLMPWTIGVRCTYSNLQVSKTAVLEIDTSLRNWAASIKGQIHSEDEFHIVCHYRLGDLLGLNTKTYVSPQELSLVIEDIERRAKASNILILTENPEFAEKNLINLLSKEFSISSRNPEVLRVLLLGKKAPFFIGTNSKISIWICLLRAQNMMSYKSTFLPKQMKQSLQNIWPDCLTFVDFF